MRASRVSSHSHFLVFVRTFSRRFLRRVLQRRVLCCAVALNLLLWPGPGLVIKHFVALAEQVLNSRVGSHSYEAYFLRRLFSQSTETPRRETTAERTASVASIRVAPAKIVGYTGQRLRFSAVGSNTRGLTIQGAQFSWSSSDAEKLQIDGSGLATLNAPGLVWVTGATPGVSKAVPVLIRAGERPPQSDSEWRADQVQLHPDGTIGTTTGGIGKLLDSLSENLAPTAHAQTNGGDSGDFLYDELWSEPRNLVGSPRYRAMTASAIGGVLPEGSNFEFSVPLYGLSGRGVSAGMGRRRDEADAERSRLISVEVQQKCFN